MKCIRHLATGFMFASHLMSLAQSAVLTGEDGTGSISQLKLQGKVIPIQDERTFAYNVSLKVPSFLTLVKNTQEIELFLQPGDSLHIVFNEEGVQFEGEVAKTNTFLVHHKKLARDNSNYLDAHNEAVFTKTPLAFKTTIDSLENLETDLFQEFLAHNGLVNKHFVQRITTDIVFRNRRYRLLYPQNYHRHHEYKEVAPLPPTYFEELMQGSFDDPLFINSSDYIRCVNFYLDLLATGSYKMKHPYHAPVKRIDARYKALINLDAEEAIQDALIKEHFNQHIWTYRVEALANSYERAKLDVKNKTILEGIKELMDVGQNRRSDADTIMLYRTTREAKLHAHVFYTEDKGALRPAHLFFHGGGWAMGMPEWSYAACKEAAEEGRVGIAFDYRLRNIHGAPIKDAVGDALAAVAWVREHAQELGVAPDKILVEGFSAGGHLALITAMVDQNDFGIPGTYSARPDALILGSTPYDVTHRDVYDLNYDAKQISPLFLVKEGLPPILAFHGESDTMVKFAEFEAFRSKMEQTSNTFQYRSFPNSGHFYDGGAPGDRAVREKMRNDFLIKNGFKN